MSAVIDTLGTTAAPTLYCLESCVQGGDVTTSATKCNGRDDFACVDLSSTGAPDPFCVPLCSSDAACGAGLYCNHGTGLCSKTKPIGDPAGTPCTPSTTAGTGSNNCSSFCLRTTVEGVTPIKGVCVDSCAGYLDCGYKGDKPGGVCFGALADTFGYLDLGYCLPSCACTDDCPFPGDLCRAWTADEQGYADDLGAPGLCLQQLTGSVELTVCQGAGGETGASGSN